MDIQSTSLLGFTVSEVPWRLHTLRSAALTRPGVKLAVPFPLDPPRHWRQRWVPAPASSFELPFDSLHCTGFASFILTSQLTQHSPWLKTLEPILNLCKGCLPSFDLLEYTLPFFSLHYFLLLYRPVRAPLSRYLLPLNRHPSFH